jgi:hypothetical protein
LAALSSFIVSQQLPGGSRWLPSPRDALLLRLLARARVFASVLSLGSLRQN